MKIKSRVENIVKALDELIYDVNSVCEELSAEQEEYDNWSGEEDELEPEDPGNEEEIAECDEQLEHLQAARESLGALIDE